MDFIDLKSQQERIRPNLEAKIKAVLDHGQYIMGPEINELEEKLSNYVGVKHCITVSSGTDALLIAMMALGVGPGDEVITTPFTFIATGEMIALLGAKPVFVDIDPATYNLDPNLIEAAITPRTKAIMPVSLYGQCADFDTINAVVKKHNQQLAAANHPLIYVIEDAAQSFGATYKGRRSCGLSTIGCTSFFPSKPLGGYGDGGACFTDDDTFAAAMRQIRAHGQDRRYHHPVIGLNGRMDTLQAAILLAKFSIFPEEVELRSQIGEKYTKLFVQAITQQPSVNSQLLTTPFIASYNISVFAQYTIQVENREQVQAKLKESGIPTAVHYPVPLHLQPAFATLGYQQGCFPVTEKLAKRVMSLPMHPYLENEVLNKIVPAVADSILRR